MYLSKLLHGFLALYETNHQLPVQQFTTGTKSRPICKKWQGCVMVKLKIEERLLVRLKHLIPGSVVSVWAISRDQRVKKHHDRLFDITTLCNGVARENC